MNKNTIQQFQKELEKFTLERHLPKNTEYLLRAVMQTSADAIILSDSKGNILLWNNGAQQIFGYEEKEILGKPLTILIPEKFKEAHLKGMERVSTMGQTRIIGKTVELEGISKYDKVFPIELSLSCWEFEGEIFFGGIIRDITDRKRFEKALQTENLRQTQELDAARELQLSMLPAELPDHSTVELAAYMKTATEVGGDYYDFDISDDDTLTLAIGDATGHGTRASIMVTATKSLWHAFSGDEDLTQVLEKSSRALKLMRLPKLYMSMALARVRDHTLELAGAGMPPALVYRAATQQVETVALEGMPLGGPATSYHTTSVSLSPGDTVVLMSDGFPELFNIESEMLGYERVVRVFAEVASRSPEKIITHLMKTGETWANGRAQDDDMTFVVMKVKHGDENG